MDSSNPAPSRRCSDLIAAFHWIKMKLCGIKKRQPLHPPTQHDQPPPPDLEVIKLHMMTNDHQLTTANSTAAAAAQTNSINLVVDNGAEAVDGGGGGGALPSSSGPPPPPRPPAGPEPEPEVNYGHITIDITTDSNYEDSGIILEVDNGGGSSSTEVLLNTVWQEFCSIFSMEASQLGRALSAASAATIYLSLHSVFAKPPAGPIFGVHIRAYYVCLGGASVFAVVEAVAAAARPV